MASTPRMMLPSLFAILSFGLQGASAGMLQQASSAATRADDKTGGAFRSASSHVEDLQAQLAQMEISNKRAQAQRKAEYEEKLSSARRQNLQVATANAQLVKEIQEVQASAQSFRTHASDLRQDVQVLQEDWKSLETNFSTALEVTGKVLKGVHELDRAPELRVLEELNEQDRGAVERAKVNHKFDDILGPSPHVDHQGNSLLQMSNPGGAHAALLAALEAGLKDLAAESTKALQELDTKYRALLKVEADNHRGLLSEQKVLEGKKRQLVQLAARLQSAIVHLEGVHHDTSRQASSVRAYFAQIGSRPLPAKDNTAPSTVVTTTTATTTSLLAAEKAHDDPDKDLFDLDSFLVETVSSTLAPPTFAPEVVASVSPKAADRHQQQVPASQGKTEWLQWFGR